MTLNTFHLAGHGGANVTLGKINFILIFFILKKIFIKKKNY